MSRGFYERRFLNMKRPGNGAAFIFIDHEQGGHYSDLRIGDCNRIVELSIDMSDEKERANSLQKLEVLVEVLGEYREWLAQDWEDV